MIELSTPISDDMIRGLKMGDTVLLSGLVATGRDAAHKWMVDTFIHKTKDPDRQDLEVYDSIKPVLNGGVIYHCGPVVAGLESGNFRFVAAGPTTSTREEPYQADVLQHFNIKAVIGKGGMGAKTLLACHDLPAAYFHAIGGAASLIAQRVTRVIDVHKLEFGVPEAIWLIEVDQFPVVVTMDSHRNSLHAEIESKSKQALDLLLEH